MTLFDRFVGLFKRQRKPQPLDVLNTRNTCPDCGSGEFVIGPRGGHAVNIKCGRCGSKFWFAPPFTPERINNDDEFYPAHRLVNLRQAIESGQE